MVCTRCVQAPWAQARLAIIVNVKATIGSQISSLISRENCTFHIENEVSLRQTSSKHRPWGHSQEDVAHMEVQQPDLTVRKRQPICYFPIKTSPYGAWVRARSLTQHKTSPLHPGLFIWKERCSHAAVKWKVSQRVARGYLERAGHCQVYLRRNGLNKLGRSQMKIITRSMSFLNLKLKRPSETQIVGPSRYLSPAILPLRGQKRHQQGHLVSALVPTSHLSLLLTPIPASSMTLSLMMVSLYFCFILTI